jgi:sulfide dehydrogenase cytochrome subunit
MMRSAIDRISSGMALVLMIMLASSASGGDIPALIDECEACHGPGGVSTQDDVPDLAGRSAEELVAAIEAFGTYQRHCSTTTYRSGGRPKTPTNMCSVANTLTGHDRQVIAEHFANQK